MAQCVSGIRTIRSGQWATQNMSDAIEEGYTKARSTQSISSRLSFKSSNYRAWQYPVFKIAMLDRWIVIVSGAEMNEGLQKLPDEQVSFDDAAAEVLPTV